jgi:beta-lactamase class A
MFLSKQAVGVFLLLCMYVAGSSISYSTESLTTKISSILKPYKAKVGVAVIDCQSGEQYSVNNNYHYIMQSVYKMHLALLVFHLVDLGKLSLEQKIHISAKELNVDSWSPIAEKYKDSTAGVTLSVREILSYTISQSDNVGCDALFELVGGTSAVHSYMKSIGIEEISIKATEAEMHRDYAKQFTNWTTPLAAVTLLHKAFTTSLLSQNSKKEFWRMMEETITGTNRLKGLLPANTIVAHKTGSSGQDKKGVTMASNDIGIITLPNGRHVAIAVFVTNSVESPKTNDRIIAKVALAVYKHFSTK